MLLLQALILAVLVMRVLGIGPPPTAAVPTGDNPYESGQRFGQALMNGLLWAWSLGGPFWASLNVYALLTRKQFARVSTLAFWLFSICVCCPIPLAIYGVISLTRPAVRQYLEKPSQTTP